MSETSFIVYLDETQENRYRHWHRLERGQIAAFLIQYEAHIAGRWRPIVRYVTAHERPHRDVLRPSGNQVKTFFPEHYTNATVMTMGQRDLLENWSGYHAAFEKEMSS